MARPDKCLLISLPTSIVSSDSKDGAFQALQASISKDYGTVTAFRIPDFKVGTLDALVNQADELSKLESGCESVVAKVGDTLKSILANDETKVAQQKTVNDKPVSQYLKSFSWNKVKYREDRPLSNMIEMLSKEVAGIDNDVKGKYNQYNQAKTNLTALEKRQTGNLASKSLTSIVPPKLVVRDSEYIETHLIAVPSQLAKDFPKTYETISPWVVPRSAVKVDSDDEYSLFAVTTFKKYSSEFLHKCREQKWTPRDYSLKQGGQEAERKELEKVRTEEKQLWGETLRLARINWGEAVMAWIHVLTLRVFVETVLRYGLPLSFVSGLIQTTPKLVKKVRANLDHSYSYLAGNALGRDKRGRAIKDDSADAMVPGQAGEVDYSAYVCYEFELN